MMKPNFAFQHALRSLAHPVSLIAIVVLLLNDHWLRLHHPSWITGKLGDFAWLVFAPFIAALLFAWCIPARWKAQESIVGAVSIAFIGLWFALAKTIPVIHALTTNAWNGIMGWEGSLRMDATDLFTLPALLITAWIWRTCKLSEFNWRPYAYIAFGLAILGTLANSYPPIGYWEDAGITTICQVGTTLVTATEEQPQMTERSRVNDGPAVDGNYPFTPQSNVFTSSDGGLTWSKQIIEHYQLPGTNCSALNQQMLIDPQNPQIQYRWQSRGPIERSTDDGATWVIDYSLPEMQQEVRRHHNQFSARSDPFRGNGFTRTFVPGPVSGLFDETTGNLVLAMGWDGVLVRTSDAVWHQIAVDEEYRIANLSGFGKLGESLFFELWLAGALGFLILTTSVAYLRKHSVMQIRIIWLTLGWVAWLILTVVLLPPSQSGEFRDFSNSGWFYLAIPSFFSLILIAIPQIIMALWDLIRNFRPYILHIIAMGALASGSFLLPFVLWSQGTIPPYLTAWFFALLLALCAVIAAGFALHPVLSVAEPKLANEKAKR